MSGKRVMIIGADRRDSAYLAGILENRKVEECAASAPVYRTNTIECPSAYLENPDMYKHLLALAQDASCIVLTISSERPDDRYSPGFAKAFSKPVIGVVTGVGSNLEQCETRLRRAGVEKDIFCISGNFSADIENMRNHIIQVQEGVR